MTDRDWRGKTDLPKTRRRRFLVVLPPMTIAKKTCPRVTRSLL